MKTIVLNVSGMSCGHCARAVEGAVEKLGASAKVDLAAKKVTVSYEEGRVTPEAIAEAIKKQGYGVES